jgi:glutamate-1-semialdehyde 2,1-aminomutase
VAAVAGLKTLEILKRPGAYERVFATGRELMAGIASLLRDAGLPAQVIGEPPLFDIIYTSGDVEDYRATLRNDTEMQKRFNRRLRDAGILKGDTKFYVSLAHDAADIRHTLAAVGSAIEAESRRPA